MPAWLASAMRLLFGSPTRAALTGATAASLAPGFLPDLPGLGPLGDFFGGDGAQRPRRRRRRRALTASDRADIAFLTGILGRPAGKELAVIIASRTT